MQATYTFLYFTQDLLAWSIIHSELDTAQHSAAIIQQLSGQARALARNFTYEELMRGGVYNGTQLDPVTYLVTRLAGQFAPLGEETRLQAMSELMSFTRLPNESTDNLLSRFLTVRQTAHTEGTGMNLSWECLAWLLFASLRV